MYIRVETFLILSRMMPDEIEPMRFPNENRATAMEAPCTLPLSPRITYKLTTILKSDNEAPCKAKEKNHFLNSIFNPYSISIINF